MEQKKKIINRIIDNKKKRLVNIYIYLIIFMDLN